MSLLALSASAHGAFAAPSAGSAQQRDSTLQYSSLAPVSVSGKQAIVQLRLSRDVYLRSHSALLNDLRLFDADGNNIKFSLINPAEQQRTSRVVVPVRAFPVFDSNKNPAGPTQEFEMKTSKDGSLLSVSTKGKFALDHSSRTLSSLILDVRSPGAGVAPTQLVGALNLGLPAGTTNYSAKVALEVSNDLKSWDPVCESPLNWLVNEQTDTLANSRIVFPPTSFRYARLTWLEGTPIEFGRIDAEFETQTALPYETDSLVVAPQAGRFPNDLLYPVALAIPVEKLGLRFHQQNIVFPAVLGQYIELPDRGLGARNTEKFHPRLRFTFYQLVQGGRTKSNLDLVTEPLHADHWILRSETAMPEKPALQISWTPSTMIFVANGRAPYTLAVGRAGAASAQLPTAQVVPGFAMDELLAAERAELGPMGAAKTNGPGQGEGANAAASARARVVLLWSFLLLGVAILGFMTWKLTAQMRGSGSPTE
jgi:hypothetical protein